MTFSQQVKAELCEPRVERKCCAVAEAYGILMYCHTFSPKLIRIITASDELAQRLPHLFKKAFSVSFDELPGGSGKRSFKITDEKKIQTIYDTFGNDLNTPSLHINFGVLEETCCKASFIRGAFLAGGSVTDPAKRYHLELTTSHYKVSRETCALLLDAGFSPKETTRGGNSILYFKQSNLIEDFLTAIGAPVCAMGVMEAKVEKDLRNGVNRRVNCETANLTKVVDASMEQVAAIRKLQKRGQLKDLPPKLRETAKLRLENPEATLQELAAMQDPPVSKSAMNHRMRKLVALANES